MFDKNYVVLYKNQPAVITECGDKYTIQFTTGSKQQLATQNVRSKDIIPLSNGKVSSLNVVYKEAETLLQQKFTEQEKEAHELLLSDGNQAVSIAELAELVFGNFLPDTSWAIYSYLHSSLLFSEQLTEEGIFFTCRTHEESELLKRKQSEKNQEQEVRAAFYEHLKKKKIQLPEDAKFMQEIEAFALGKAAKSRVLKEAGFSETEESAHKLLLDTGFWQYYKNPYPSRWGLSMQSASECLSHPPAEERLKIQHTAYAIDNEWSNDPDDAVFFDGEYLWVHIADPASTVKPDSKIDISARNRGATLYLPEGAARMLAEESLEDYALGLAEESHALSFRLKLDASGAITETAVYRTIVNVKRLTYAQADREADSNELAPLFAIAARNIERRRKAGAVFIELPEVHISVVSSVDGGTPDITITPIEKTKAADMVREMMLLAGEGSARFAFKNGISFPYISQEKPDIPKDLHEGLTGQYRLRRCMRPRSVGIIPSDHAGLGLGMYSQVTSPLRRYSDLAAHQQLRAFICNEPLLNKDVLLERISAGDASASAAVKAERKSNMHWILCYLLQHLDWTAEGIIVELLDRRATVLIPSLAQETQIPLPASATLNETILLKASNIDIARQTVTFMPVE